MSKLRHGSPPIDIYEPMRHIMPIEQERIFVRETMAMFKEKPIKAKTVTEIQQGKDN